MSKDAAYLESRGWKIISKKKIGMVWRIRWAKPGGNSRSQGDALRSQRQQDHMQKFREDQAKGKT